MRNIYQLLIFGLIGYLLASGSRPLTSFDILGFLVLLIIDLLRVRYFPKKFLILIEWTLLLICCLFDSAFTIGWLILLPEAIADQKLMLQRLGFLVAPVIFLLNMKQLFLFFLAFGLCFFFVQLMDRIQKMEAHFRKITDEERQYIYELEKSKQQLQLQAEEQVRLAELKERNRIARQLHDSVGHRIAGLYMQLQAAHKIRRRDTEKSEELTTKTIAGLSETLRLIRDTAHDLVPKAPSGPEKLRQMVQSFHYCEASLVTSGSLKEVPDKHWQIIETNVKEALTNVFKHSGATQVSIELVANNRFVRLFIRDNGKGSPVIRDHIGLSGMRERVEQIGGSLSVDGSLGFTIVCLLPLRQGEGEIFAAAHR